MANNSKKNFSFYNRLWDIWCCISLIGIWPRFIEPNLICSTHLRLPIFELPRPFHGFKIVFFSDIHISEKTSSYFLQKVSKKIAQEKPNLIVIGGDFFTYAQSFGKPLLEQFLQSLSASHGIFACPGNHDYEQYVTMDNNGSYAIESGKNISILSGFERLFRTKTEKTVISKNQHNIFNEGLKVHPELLDLLKECDIHLLENCFTSIFQDGAKLQIGGLGDLMAGKCIPEKMFTGIDTSAPIIILSHNPDSWNLIREYPGDLYLFGHTHGGQVNLPFLWKKLTPIMNKHLKRGLFIDQVFDTQHRVKQLYISRGIGSTFPFRWFSPPELTVITLEQEKEVRVVSERTNLKNLFTSSDSECAIRT